MSSALIGCRLGLHCHRNFVAPESSAPNPRRNVTYLNAVILVEGNDGIVLAYGKRCQALMRDIGNAGTYGTGMYVQTSLLLSSATWGHITHAGVDVLHCPKRYNDSLRRTCRRTNFYLVYRCTGSKSVSICSRQACGSGIEHKEMQSKPGETPRWCLLRVAP